MFYHEHPYIAFQNQCHKLGVITHNKSNQPNVNRQPLNWSTLPKDMHKRNNTTCRYFQVTAPIHFNVQIYHLQKKLHHLKKDAYIMSHSIITEKKIYAHLKWQNNEPNISTNKSTLTARRKRAVRGTRRGRTQPSYGSTHGAGVQNSNHRIIHVQYLPITYSYY